MTQTEREIGADTPLVSTIGLKRRITSSARGRLMRSLAQLDVNLQALRMLRPGGASTVAA